MEQSPWESHRFSASQEVIRILWNQKVHYRIHKFPPPVPILSHLDPVHILTSHCGSFPRIKRQGRQADIEIHLEPKLTFLRATSSIHHIPSGPGAFLSTGRVPLSLTVPHTGTLLLSSYQFLYLVLQLGFWNCLFLHWFVLVGFLVRWFLCLEFWFFLHFL